MSDREYTYEELRTIIDKHLSDFLPEVDQNSMTIYDSMKYSLTAGGKRLRPVLLLAACDFAGGNIKEALPYACAIEYIHTYSLIHDDLPCMDDDDLRRGKPTNHKEFGEAMAVLAGDGLLSSAFEMMNRDLFMYLDDEKALKRRICAMYEILHGAGCYGMLGGQVADVENESKEISGELLDYIHINKTAALIMAAVRAGCYLGCADSDILSNMTNYAEALGLAFQIKDDVLDVTGDEKELGKRTGADKDKGKNTYPSVYGLDASYERLEQLRDQAMEAIAPYYDNAEFFAKLVDLLHQRRK